MAGAGYKLFNTGDVLLASEVNTYLMQQTVMVFADSAARTTALSGVLAEGMISYLADTNATEVYNGSAWVSVSGTGDITAVTTGANSGLAGGVTTGNADIKINFASKGQLAVGTGSGTTDFLNVGTNGYTIVADSTETTGLKWAAPAGGGANWSLVNSGGTALTGATTVTVSGISGADKIMVIISAASAGASNNIRIRLNSDSNSNYFNYEVYNDYGSTYDASNFSSKTNNTTGIILGFLSTNAASAINGYILLSGCNSAGQKIYNYAGAATAAGGTAHTAHIGGGRYDSASTISSVSVVSSSANLDAGTVYVYTSA